MKYSHIAKPLVVGTSDACRLLGCGKSTLFETLLPELDSYMQGSRRMISVASIERLVAKRLAASDKKETA
jgi:ABC-type lipoprotein export system ATPase subunit